MFADTQALEEVRVLREQYQMLLRAVGKFGLEAGFNKFPGVYRAYVYDNKDSENRGRVRIHCPDVGHIPESPPTKWAESSFQGADANRGSFHVPEIGDVVFVSFYHGDPSWPWCYWGGWYAKDELPSEFAYSTKDGTPQKGGWISRGGHRMVWDDEAGSESLTVAWHKPDPTDPAVTNLPTKPGAKTVAADRTKGLTSTLSFGADGSIDLVNANGTHVQLDATNKKIVVEDKDNSNTVVLDSSGVVLTNGSGSSIELKGGSCTVNVSGAFTVNAGSVKLNSTDVQLDATGAFHALNAETYMTLYRAHTHPTAVGPTLPPLPIPEVLVQSSMVKL